MRRGVPALFLCSALFSQAATNWWDGLAYGTNDWSKAGSIISQASTNGSLIVGHESTTNLTLNHNITGYLFITNKVEDFKVDATGSTNTTPDFAVVVALNSTNLVITGGHFIGSEGSGGSFPPIPGQSQPTNSTISAMGGLLLNSIATINGAEFAGVNSTDGLVVERSELTTSNSIFRGGNTGTGLVARNNSTVTIHSGNFTGGVDNTAFYLQDSDATIHGGTFVGNVGGSSTIAGAGLFSKLTGATTNQVSLHGGTFSSLAFYGTDDSVQHFLAGTNLTVQNGIIQSNGTVIVDNQSDSALQDILVSEGAMEFLHPFTLEANGAFILGGQNSAATFDQIHLASRATMDIGNASVLAHTFIAESFSTNRLAITSQDHGLIDTQMTHFHTNSALLIDASAASVGSLETNDYMLISANTNQLFAGTSTNTAATAESFKDNVNIETISSDRTRFVDLFFDTVGGNTLVNFQFTAMPLSEYWGLSNGTSTVVTEEFADELDLSASSEMLAIIDGLGSSAQSLAAVEEAYFTTFNTFQTSMQGLQAAVGQSVSRGAEFREELKLLPPGAKGPQRRNDLRGWGKYHGQFLTRDAEGSNPAYETTLHAGTIGVDKSFGNLLLGISGGGGNYSTTTDHDDEENIEAYHGALYGTYGAERGYLDAGIAYGFNKVDTRSGDAFGLNGDFDAEVVNLYFGGGYDLVDTDGGTVFTPEASIQYAMYKQEAYSETSTVGATPRTIDAFDADSLRSSIGLNVSMLNTTALETFGFKLDGRFHWLHEFNPEPGNMTFGLEDGSNDYQLAAPLLDEEVFRAGFGVSFFNTLRNKPKNVLLRLDFDELFGDGFNAHNLSVKLVYAF